MNEISAGGVIVEKKQILLVMVKNLTGKIVWTFPKGHIEAGETSDKTALREVREETGYDCEIIKPLGETRYFFKRKDVLIDKTVTWFLMKPKEKTGEHDSEILTTKWVELANVKKYISYKSDIELMEKIL